MRMTAPAISGAAVVLAAALVWVFRPAGEFAVPSPAAAAVPEATPAVVAGAPPSTPPQREATAVPTPSVARSPLPGEAPSTPMADLMATRQADTRPEAVEGELEFSAEPVDATWAPGAEAQLLAKIAEMQGLQLLELQVHCRSTMCRLQLTQPRAATGGVQGGRPMLSVAGGLGLEPRWFVGLQDPNGPTRSVMYLWRDGFAPKQEQGQPHSTQ